MVFESEVKVSEWGEIKLVASGVQKWRLEKPELLF